MNQILLNLNHNNPYFQVHCEQDAPTPRVTIDYLTGSAHALIHEITQEVVEKMVREPPPYDRQYYLELHHRFQRLSDALEYFRDDSSSEPITETTAHQMINYIQHWIGLLMTIVFQRP